MTWEPGARLGSVALRTVVGRPASCPTGAFTMESWLGGVLAHLLSPLEALGFERERGFLMGFLPQEYQSASEKH